MSTLSKPRRGRKGTLFLLLFLICAVIVFSGFFLFFEGERPSVAITGPSKYLGAAGEISFAVSDRKSGLHTISLSVIQNGTSKEVYGESFQRTGYTGMIGVPEKRVTVVFAPLESGFSDGSALLRLEVSDYSMRGYFQGNRVVAEREIIIDTTAPKLSILHSERYVNPGGSGIVIYRINDPEATGGVVINDDFHPGFPVGDGREDTFISFFGVRYDADALKKTAVTAVDPAGNRAMLPFSVNFKSSDFKKDRIDVGDSFLEQKIPEFQQHYPQMQGTLIDKYLFANNELRNLNNATISDLCKTPHPERLWEKAFARMPGSSRAGFADHRTYYYAGAPVDKQVHLGIDIASTRQADVRAAAKGIVVFADYLGIYGNAVMVDHGQGVFSLYSHLSQINVSKEDPVARDTVLGLTGTSGMAGGDHLHFSVLINGVFVTPVEWWDQHWIDVTVEDPLAESRFN